MHDLLLQDHFDAGVAVESNGLGLGKWSACSENVGEA